MKRRQYGFVEVHGSGFPLKTSEHFDDKAEAVIGANRAYCRAVNTGSAAGVRFGMMDETGHVKGRLVMTKSRRKYPNGPFV
jgi:hypothetical protein